MSKVALIAGASGLIGSYLLPQLLDDDHYHQILVIGRRPPSLLHQKQRVLISDLSDIALSLAGHRVDDVYCALGTTIAKAGTAAEFARVDRDAVLHLAVAAQQAQCQQMLVVSAIGANRRSLSFYSRTKGQMEEALKALGLPCLHVFQPSLLLGQRPEKRRAEELGQKLSPLLSPLLCGPLTRYQPVAASTVASAMHKAAARNQRGLYIHRMPFD